ncbi:DUF2905 domain-containing protein [Clostridium formicaceticum]|uniref:DUF2905 domain-containing protein n=1 Tax=Clostridium formicaceticum TaxID=1497 RepID=A0AAC9WG44_9CLOT|nr:DUF2905 domain-containing protein [Clostridium formicaceticum]AOY76938.1 hypothetical protein BJL90_14375 [Clostridium formicaceticum]ARE87419.1 hypothetical protein CLFO_18190 [Clostridium formicaceticum]
MEGLGRTLILLGIVIFLAGGLLTIGGRLGLGRLPGDIFFQKGNFSFYFPLVTSIILSVFLTLILNLFRR